MKKVPVPKVVTTLEATESPLPPQVQEALGELVGAAREGLLALSVGVGLGVVHELMALEVDEVVGPKGKWNPDRSAKRHGHEHGSMTLGGRRVQVPGPADAVTPALQRSPPLSAGRECWPGDDRGGGPSHEGRRGVGRCGPRDAWGRL